MRRLVAIPIALLLLTLGALWWSGALMHREVPADFVFINRGDIGTLDPNSMSWLQDIRMAYGLWEGLYSLDPQTFEPIPGCADRVSDIDKRIFTFHIRDDARWSNGDDVVADDFIFAWRRMLEEPGDYTYLLHKIRGAKAYQEAISAYYDALAAAGKKGKSELARARVRLKPPAFDVGIEKLDAKTLRVTLDWPVTFFPDLCAFPPMMPLHEKSMQPFAMVDPITGKRTYNPEFTRPPDLVSNGPYRLEAWEFHKRLRLVASDHYWDKASVKSRVIDMLSFSDPRTAFLKYETGKVDWLAEVGADDAADLRDHGRNDLHIFGGFGTYFYSVNCLPTLPDGSRNPLADVRVRQALTMALDKKPIVDNVARLGQPIATTFVPPDCFAGYALPKGLGYDPQRARELLAAAGYPNGKGFPRAAILFNNEGDHKFIAQIVRKQWYDTLGIDMEMGGVEIKTFRTKLHAKDYTIARASWIGDYADVTTFTDKYLSDSENNDSGWKNERFDKLCEDASHEKDPQTRLNLLSQAEQILCDEAPIIPLYYYVNAYMFRKDVTGVPLHPRNMVMFKAMKAARR